LTKADLIEAVFREIQTTQKEAVLVVEIVFDSMARALQSGDKIEIRGFGSFRTRPRQARIARNPKTGATVKVPAKRIPFFRPSREVLAILNPSVHEAAAPPATDPVNQGSER
jgi:integration host factor subunit beta